MIRNKKHFVYVDMICDTEARYVTNVIIGTLETVGPSEVFLLTREALDSVNNSTIYKVFERSMVLLWPQGIRHDDLLLFVTDAAPIYFKSKQANKVTGIALILLFCVASKQYLYKFNKFILFSFYNMFRSFRPSSRK
jgi:hypothetical protein